MAVGGCLLKIQRKALIPKKSAALLLFRWLGRCSYLLLLSFVCVPVFDSSVSSVFLNVFCDLRVCSRVCPATSCVFPTQPAAGQR